MFLRWKVFIRCLILLELQKYTHQLLPSQNKMYLKTKKSSNKSFAFLIDLKANFSFLLKGTIIQFYSSLFCTNSSVYAWSVKIQCLKLQYTEYWNNKDFKNQKRWSSLHTNSLTLSSKFMPSQRTAIYLKSIISFLGICICILSFLTKYKDCVHELFFQHLYARFNIKESWIWVLK